MAEGEQRGRKNGALGGLTGSEKGEEERGQ